MYPERVSPSTQSDSRRRRSRALLSPEEEDLFARRPNAQYLFKWRVLNPNTDYFLFEVVTRLGGRTSGDTWDLTPRLQRFCVGDVSDRWRKAIRLWLLEYPTATRVQTPDMAQATSFFLEWSQRHAG
jgi:hypothetical protein